MSRFSRAVGGVALLAAAILLAPAATAAPGDVVTLPNDLVATQALASDASRGVYWTAPDGARLVAVNPSGSKAGEVTWDAEVSSVDALANLDGKIYAAQLGDGEAVSQVTVDRLEAVSYGSSSPFSRWTFSYPDGPKAADAMMVSPKGNIWIVTKGNPGGFYYAPAPDSSGNFILTREADAPAWVTDGVFVDASTAVLRTYTTVLSVDMFSYQTTGAQAAPEQDRGEAVATTLSGSGVLLGSVGDPKLVEAERPTVVESLPAAPSAAPGGAANSSAAPGDEASGEATEQAGEENESPEAEETSQATASDSGRQKLGRRKTIAAVLISVVIAVGAGVVAYRKQ